MLCVDFQYKTCGRLLHMCGLKDQMYQRNTVIQRTPVVGQTYQGNIVIPENADDETGARHISETLWYQRTSMIGQMYQWNVVKPESASGGADLSMKRCNTRELQWWDRRISETWNQTVSVMGQMYQWNVVIPENTSDGTDVSVKRCDTREHQWWDRRISEMLWCDTREYQ